MVPNWIWVLSGVSGLLAVLVYDSNKKYNVKKSRKSKKKSKSKRKTRKSKRRQRKSSKKSKKNPIGQKVQKIIMD